MPTCKNCGAHGFLLFLDENGLCSKCRKATTRAGRAKFKIDFVNKFGVTIKDAQIEFGYSAPGTFLLNGVEEPLAGRYVDDVGLSSDFKYRKIFTYNFAFWVTPSDFSSFYRQLQIVAREIPFSKPSLDTTFSDYLGPSRNYIEETLDFNAEGVSHSFEFPAKDIISKLCPGDYIQLAIDNSFKDETKVALLTVKKRQIGWLPLTSELSFEDIELLSQLKAGFPLVANVIETGMVSGKDIWWCHLRLNIKIPYSKSEELVYIAPSGYLYHKNPKCNSHITDSIPISFAKRMWLSPCKKCYPTTE